MYACSICGAMATDLELMSDHLVSEHTDAMVRAMVDDWLRECYQIYELEKMWRLSA